VTARHVLKNHRWEPEDVRVPVRLDSMEMLSLDYVVEHEPMDEDDTDVADVLLLRVAAGVPRYTLAPRIALDDIATAAHWTAGDDLRVFGFPTSLDNEVVHENRTVQRERYDAGAKYVRKSAATSLHELEFEQAPRVRTIDGMSGAPVFSSVAGAEKWSFAGMLVRGTHDTSISRAGYFIEGRVIVRALAKAMDNA
jgi:hypothetical protein